MTIYEFLQKAHQVGDLCDEDAAELASVLNNKSVKRLMAAIDAEANAVLTNAAGWNLTSPQGIAEATTSQGRARGLKRALDIIWDAAGGEH